MDNIDIKKYTAYKISELPEPKWILIIGNNRDFNAFTIEMRYEEAVPNWFHRLMQRIVLGFIWERIDKQAS